MISNERLAALRALINARDAKPRFERRAEVVGLAAASAAMVPEMLDELESLRGVAVQAREWEGLYNTANRMWRKAEDRIDAVGKLLGDNGCDCGCDHSYSDHTDDCERCFACRVSAALFGRAP